MLRLEEVNNPIKPNSKRNWKVVITVISIVAIVIISGSYLKFSYWNYDFTITMSPVPTYNESIEIQLKVTNTGFMKMKFNIKCGTAYSITTQNESYKSDIGWMFWISGDQELAPGEDYQWNFNLEPNTFSHTIDNTWTKGDWTFYCAIKEDGKWGHLNSNTISFTIE